MSYETRETVETMILFILWAIMGALIVTIGCWPLSIPFFGVSFLFWTPMGNKILDRI